MIETHPSWIWVVGSFVHSAALLRQPLSKEAALDAMSALKQGLELFLREESTGHFYPRSTDRANGFLAEVNKRIYALANGEREGNIGDLANMLRTFTVSVQDEMDRHLTFTLIPKGNLSVHALFEGASNGYSKDVLVLMDATIREEVDEAGKCLACDRATACGFHILRSVEIGVKAYVYAVNGSLPPLNRRNWGEYISQLTTAGASPDLLDVLRVLKTKRNPLMHPQDNLDLGEALDIFCLCQAGMGALVQDIKGRTLEQKFTAALGILPTLK